jgi:hypothetical protein
MLSGREIARPSRMRRPYCGLPIWISSGFRTLARSRLGSMDRSQRVPITS